MQVNMPHINVSSSRKRAFGSISELIVAWSLGLLFGVSLFLPIILIVGVAVAAVYSLGSSSPPGYFILLPLIAGLGVVSFSSILLGAFWAGIRKGIKAGLVAVPAEVVAFFLTYHMWGYVGNLSTPSGWYENWNYIVELVAMLIPEMVAAVAITTIVLMCTKPFPGRVMRLCVGLAVGLVISAIDLFVFRHTIFKGGNLFHLLWQVPALMWLSAVYFMAAMKGKSRWRRFLVWVALVVVSLGLPFIVVPAFCINC
jgi:hypothetical protein